MNYIFGPVPSRRLGQSLGIDTIPQKTCNWNCVYCQLGRTIPLTNERREYFPRNEILGEVKTALDGHKPGEIDWITFVGSGEPTLHTEIGWLIRQIKAITHIPVAVITNGSLLNQPEVRSALAKADAVLPTLDAGNNKLFQKINRPHPEITFECFFDGLVQFRKGYQGKLWVEVMLVRGLNDNDDSVQEIADCLHSVQPDEVHIVQPTRPPAESWVKPPDEEGLHRAYTAFGGVSRVIHSAIGSFDLSGHDTLADAVFGIISRHPVQENVLIQILEQAPSEEVIQTLKQLWFCNQVQVVERFGVRFWSAADLSYPEDVHSQRLISKKYSPKTNSSHGG
jgi:wyosine [tRNA(Phe)-imidazoG37] synthetase (radical SAM superfamily)